MKKLYTLFLFTVMPIQGATISGKALVRSVDMYLEEEFSEHQLSKPYINGSGQGPFYRLLTEQAYDIGDFVMDDFCDLNGDNPENSCFATDIQTTWHNPSSNKEIEDSTLNSKNLFDLLQAAYLHFNGGNEKLDKKIANLAASIDAHISLYAAHFELREAAYKNAIGPCQRMLAYKGKQDFQVYFEQKLANKKRKISLVRGLTSYCKFLAYELIVHWHDSSDFKKELPQCENLENKICSCILDGFLRMETPPIAHAINDWLEKNPKEAKIPVSKRDKDKRKSNRFLVQCYTMELKKEEDILQQLGPNARQKDCKFSNPIPWGWKPSFTHFTGKLSKQERQKQKKDFQCHIFHLLQNKVAEYSKNPNKK